jgi:hypothetical protein
MALDMYNRIEANSWMKDAESDSRSVPMAGEGFVFMRVSDRGPNSSRLRRESEAFFG